MQAANAPRASATVFAMDEAELILWRIDRLQAAIDRLTEGNVSAFGVMLGYRDGAFIRQMLSGKRAISEKTIWKIESHKGMAGWFRPGANNAAGALASQIADEITSREVPEPILRTILEMLRGFPVKQKAA
jgi:hypothetical protein